jgi:hypothetical protein
MNGNGINGSASHPKQRPLVAGEPLHPAWRDFIRYCEELRFGELEKLKIQDGIPMMAELTTRKVKFGL